MVPFAVFSVIGHLFTCVHMWFTGDYNWMHYILSPIKGLLLSEAVGGNLALWFLPSLLCVQLLYSALYRKMRNEWIVAIAFVAALLTHNLSYPVPLYVGNVPLGLLAYSMGHLMRDVQFRKDTFLLSLIVYVVIFVIQPENIDFRVNYFSKGIYPIAIMFGLSGCVVINNLFKRLSVSFRLLEYVGVRSMPFYVMHWIVVSVCSWTLPLSGWSMFAAIAVSCLIILPFVEKAVSYLRMEWVFGVKKIKNHNL